VLRRARPSRGPGPAARRERRPCRRDFDSRSGCPRDLPARLDDRARRSSTRWVSPATSSSSPTSSSWASDNGIPVGPGRGSGAGSLVAYALGITELDPLAYDLLFERFLNPERVSMPDFDVDFCMDGATKSSSTSPSVTGATRSSQIITYGTMAAKAVVRDVGRVLGMPYGFVDQLAKLIPFEIGMTLDKALAEEPALKQRYDDEEDVRT
jgi:hypothetical protein